MLLKSPDVFQLVLFRHVLEFRDLHDLEFKELQNRPVADNVRVNFLNLVIGIYTAVATAGPVSRTISLWATAPPAFSARC